MEIKQLRYFIEVAKREHISETALELNIAQSAISRQITLLEQELNVSLFKKQGRNITLTSEGKLLFNEALRIIEHLDSTIEQFQSHGLTKIKVSTLAMMRVTYPTCYYHLSKRFIYKMIHMSYRAY